MHQARAAYLMGRELGMTADVALHLQADAMRSAHQIGREILAALEAMRPFLDHVPAQARRPVDLTSLGEAFGASQPG